MEKKKTDNSRKLPFQITDVIWDQIQPFLAKCPKIYVGNSEKCRLFLSAVLWVAKEETTWGALSDKYGKTNAIYQRFRHWCDAGVFEQLQTHFHADKEVSNLKDQGNL